MSGTASSAESACPCNCASAVERPLCHCCLQQFSGRPRLGKCLFPARSGCSELQLSEVHQPETRRTRRHFPYYRTVALPEITPAPPAPQQRMEWSGMEAQVQLRQQASQAHRTIAVWTFDMKNLGCTDPEQLWQAGRWTSAAGFLLASDNQESHKSRKSFFMAFMQAATDWHCRLEARPWFKRHSWRRQPTPVDAGVSNCREAIRM